MISDHVTLGSSSSYLLNQNGQPNLAADIGLANRTPRLLPDQIWDIAGIELLLERTDLAPLLTMADDQPTPLIEIRVQKEMFPSLFASPFETRTHSLAGSEDFRRGKFQNCFDTNVNGVPTIVSRGSDRCVWTSAIYQAPLDLSFAAASWELASSRLIDAAQFEYNIKLNIWHNAQTDRPPDATLMLANHTDADDARSVPIASQDATSVRAFQLVFAAEVRAEAAFSETHQIDTPAAKASIGTPLLRGIRLVQNVENHLCYHSLAEMIQAASFYQMLPLAGGFQQLMLMLDTSAVLVGRHSADDASSDDYEFFEVTVHDPRFQRVQARLVVNERLILRDAREA